MYVFKIIFLFIISFNLLGAELEQRLLSTFSYKVLLDKELSSDELNLPPGTHHALISFKVYDENFNALSYCLNIKAKEKVEPGELYLVKSNESCEKTLLNSDKVWRSSYYNFEARFRNNNFYLQVDEKKYLVKLVNIKSLKKEKFSSHIAQNQYGAVEIGIGTQGSSLPQIQDGEICRQVNDDCKIVFDKCDLCTGGSYYFKNNKCTKFYSKVCGINTCGVRGEVACLRGSISTGLSDYCIQDSPLGFCHDGSRVACVNNTLICE
jgi:hypothetical protein